MIVQNEPEYRDEQSLLSSEKGLDFHSPGLLAFGLFKQTNDHLRH